MESSPPDSCGWPVRACLACLCPTERDPEHAESVPAAKNPRATAVDVVPGAAVAPRFERVRRRVARLRGRCRKSAFSFASEGS